MAEGVAASVLAGDDQEHGQADSAQHGQNGMNCTAAAVGNPASQYVRQLLQDGYAREHRQHEQRDHRHE
jgi:hypothetical protein